MRVLATMFSKILTLPHQIADGTNFYKRRAALDRRAWWAPAPLIRWWYQYGLKEEV